MGSERNRFDRYWPRPALDDKSFDRSERLGRIPDYPRGWLRCSGNKRKCPTLPPFFSASVKVLQLIPSPPSQSYIAIQNLVPAAQIPIAMAILIFCQNLGGAVLLIVAQTVFSSSLRDQLTQLVPDADAALIIAAGARSVRQVVSGEQLAGVLQAYSVSVDRVMYLGVATSAAAFAFACGLGWKDIRVERGRKSRSSEAAMIV